MSTIYRCDRCGDDFKSATGNMGKINVQRTLGTVNTPGNNKDYELCTHCIDQISNALAPLPRAMTVEESAFRLLEQIAEDELIPTQTEIGEQTRKAIKVLVGR